jgi:hypothetical protein
MSPKPIKSVGRVRPEAVVEPSRERASEAFRMAVSGDSSSAEYIAMIDAQVAAGQLTDDLTQEIRAEIGELFGDQEGYDYGEFIGAISGGAADAVSDEGFKSSFDFQKKGFDSVRDMARKYREDMRGKERKELSPKDKATLKSTIAQIMRDPTMSREAMLVSEVDRAMMIIRRYVLSRLGILKEPSAVQAALGQMIPGIEPLEVSGDEEVLDSPSDVHMDLGALDQTLTGVAKGAASKGCGCGGHCHSRGG